MPPILPRRPSRNETGILAPFRPMFSVAIASAASSMSTTEPSLPCFPANSSQRVQSEVARVRKENQRAIRSVPLRPAVRPAGTPPDLIGELGRAPVERADGRGERVQVPPAVSTNADRQKHIQFGSRRPMRPDRRHINEF